MFQNDPLLLMIAADEFSPQVVHIDVLFFHAQLVNIHIHSYNLGVSFLTFFFLLFLPQLLPSISLYLSNLGQLEIFSTYKVKAFVRR
jgi:hypothetical protein